MTRCDDPGCAGHLGKYPDCLTEALHYASLHGFDETTGSSEFGAHYTLMTFYVVESLAVDETDRRFVYVPAGTYLVEEDDRGSVTSARFSTVDEARKVFAEIDARYGAWLEINE